MSFERDDAMFREQDARNSGARQAAASTGREFYRNLMTAFSVEAETVTGLMSRDLAAHEAALSAIASVIESRLADAERRTRMYTSEDPQTVAEIIWDEQTDVEESIKPDQDGVSWYDTYKYQFEIDYSGQLSAMSPRWAAPFKNTKVDGAWVANRFDHLGIERTEEFIESVVGQLALQAQIGQGAKNG